MSSSRTDRAATRARLTHIMMLAGACCGEAIAGVHPRVLELAARDNSVDTILVFADQSRPALAPLVPAGDYRVRRRALVEALKARAGSAQSATRAWLDANGIAHRDFWIANLIEARVPRYALAELGARGDVVRVDPNPQIALRLPHREGMSAAPSTNLVDLAAGIAWGVAKIGAPAVWSAGFRGEGVVIGGEDTGYQWDHPVLQPQYRGWNGTSVDHDYNWHDAVHDAASEPLCGNDSPYPCDPNEHGTHTAGTFSGDDGPTANPRHQTGVAPGARWIGCRNMDKSGNGTPARYIECMQWMLEPTDSSDANPAPDLAPDIVSNSWYCPVSEGCTTGFEIQAAVDNLVAAGIFYAAAAGNGGAHGCESIAGAPAIYDSSFVVGATDSSDALAGFSSRGPATDNETPPQVISTKIRPDVSAPGVDVMSAVPTNAYTTLSGTSMATPHVAGVAALLLSAFPELKGHPDKIAAILRASAKTAGVIDPVAGETCYYTGADAWPNYIIGYGRIDAWNAYHEIIFLDDFDH